MFTLSPAAAVQILRAAAEQQDNPPLRVAAKIEADGEMVYGMGFDAEREDDVVVESEGVRVLIAPPSQPLLDAARLDFIEIHPGEFQFVFSHSAAPVCGAPVAKPGGCGSCGGGGCA